MNTFITADLHFDHKALIEKGCRPQNVDKLIIDNWNKAVKPNDTVIVLGDVTWSSNTHMDELTGHKILVKGNHDHKSVSWYMNHGFDFACESLSMHLCNMNILFTHKPISSIGFGENILNIHGHLHDMKHPYDAWDNYRYLVVLERNGYNVEKLSDLLPTLYNKLYKGVK